MLRPIIDKILDEIRGSWRFRWQALGVAWAVSLAGWLYAMSLPDLYEATTRIYIDTRTALKPILQGIAIEQDIGAQLTFVRQNMLGRPQLEKVAREANLDLAAKTPEERARVVNDLRQRIYIGVNSAEGSGSVLTIRYQHPNRETSLKVVDVLLNSFVEDTLGGKRVGSEAAQQFLRNQIKEYEERLSKAEQRLADFKRRNVGMMPGEQGDYFSRLQAEMEAIKKARADLAVAMERREELTRQLRGEGSLLAASTPAAGVPGAAAPGGDTAQRIKETQAKLDELLLRFTDMHPDVVALRETLEQLKQRQATEIEALRRGDPGAAAASGAAASPVYQSILLARNQVDVEIAALRGDIAERERRVAQLRQMVDTVPEVEAEYARLNRDYDVTRATYLSLVDRLERARIGDDAEATGAVRFEVIDPPAAGFEPVAPNRKRLLLMSLIAGLALGAGLSYLLHQLKPVFSNGRMLNEITGLPVLGVVSMTWLDKRNAEARRSFLWFSAAATALLFACVGMVLFERAGSRVIQALMG